MVIAGPGTGKTSILTVRIANILQKTDASPDSILALSFTESGAYSMRRKLVEIIGGAAYRVGIFTFHGFANRIIEQFGESFPRIIGGRPATAVDQVKILENIFLRNLFKLIRPFGDIFYYVPRALRAIRGLKQENISPAVFKKMLVAEARALAGAPDRLHASGRFRGELKASFRTQLRKIEKSRELGIVYAQYEDALARERLFDFEDMMLQAIRALEEDSDLLRTLQERYQYILADEHQDANNAQNRMLELLCSFDDQPNLFIVGDEKQAIYRFQGASLENFLYFKKRFPKALLVTLKENYRSPQSILDAAHSLMEKGEAPQELPRAALRPRLKGKTVGHAPSVRFLEFSRDAAEIGFLVGDIERRVKEGSAPHEIAVLFRDNEDAFPIVEALERTSIPFAVLSDEDVLKDEELRKLLHILRAVSEPGNPELFAEMLHFDFLGVEPVSLYELLAFCHGRRVSVFDALRNPKLRVAASGSGVRQIQKVFSDFSRWAGYARNRGAGEVVENIARESGFLGYLLGRRGSLRALEKLDSLFSHLKELSAHQRVFRLSDFLESLARLQKHGMRLSGKGVRPEFYDSITLLTAHRAKGLEFDVVYITRATDGHWGGRRNRTDFHIPLVSDARILHHIVNLSTSDVDVENEDERRLFFVALTRARKEVIITMAREGEGEGGRRKLPSQFVEDIEPLLLTREDTGGIERALSSRTPFYLKPKINTGPSVTLREYLQKVFLEQGLTVTALNNYLACPWEYFFKNLVRLPQLPEPYLSYGTAVHAALHRFCDTLRNGRRLGGAGLLRFFNRALEKSSLPRREFEEYKERGRRALTGYFKKYRGSFVADALNEFKVTGVFLPLSHLSKGVAHPDEPRVVSPVLKLKEVPPSEAGRDLHQLLLRGKLDKIERNPDGTVTVVDYKTGTHKSRAHILGDAKSSEGNMKRQLDFYKLLLDNFENGKYRMTAGIIDFVEPDKNGKYHREEFEITDADVFALTLEVRRVGEEIYNFEFWDKRCRNRKCEWCLLRRSLP